MKKVALSLLALALVGTAAFADDSMAGSTVPSPVTATVAADGYAQFGVDLDTHVYGFKTGHDATLTLWFLNGTNTKTGDGDVHGSISIADVKLGYDGLAAGGALTLSFGDVTAKIVAGDLYVKLWTNTDPSQAYAGSVAADGVFSTYSNTYGADSVDWNDGNTGIKTFDATASNGIEVGYTIPGTLSITGSVGSENDWTAAELHDFDGSVAVGILAVPNLTLNLKTVIASVSGTQNIAAGANAGYDLGIVAPYANFNMDVSNSAWGADFGLSSSKLADGLTLLAGGSYTDKGVVDALVTVSLAEGKLVGPLSSDIGARLIDLTGTAGTTEVYGKVGINLGGGITAFGKGSYNMTKGDDPSMFIHAGLDAAVISLTTISVYWDSSDLGAKASTGSSKLGQLYLQGKVSF